MDEEEVGRLTSAKKLNSNKYKFYSNIKDKCQKAITDSILIKYENIKWIIIIRHTDQSEEIKEELKNLLTQWTVRRGQKQILNSYLLSVDHS